MDTPSTSSLTRNCITCRQPNLDAFKNCSSCREKNRERQRQQSLRATERKLAQQQAEPTMLAQSAHNKTHSDAKVVPQERCTPTGATKRKTPLATHDFNVHIASKRSKDDLRESEPQEPDRPQAKLDETSTAYQYATLMYSELQHKICQRMNFRGHHSIVAASDVDDAQRVEIARKDLRNIVRLPFDHKSAVKLRDSGFSLRFKCTCLGHLGNVPRSCGGKVTVTARADDSNPFVPGQVISVSVAH